MGVVGRGEEALEAAANCTTFWGGRAVCIGTEEGLYLTAALVGLLFGQGAQTEHPKSSDPKSLAQRLYFCAGEGLCWVPLHTSAWLALGSGLGNTCVGLCRLDPLRGERLCQPGAIGQKEG